jgi:hypothetical protein
LNLLLGKFSDLQFLLLQRARRVDLFILGRRNLLKRINYVIKIELFLILKKEIMYWKFR